MGYPIKPFSSPKTWTNGEWEYRVYYIYKGTSKEGMNAYLLYKGHYVRPVFARDFIQTPFGDMTYLPAAMTLQPNALMGWHFTDFSKIPWTTLNHPSLGARHDWHKVDAVIDW
jgi:hypothetical protein